MNYYVGIDVSLEASSVCVIDATGKIVREGKVASEPEALIAWFKSVGVSLARIGLEAGPLSRWLYAAMRQKENDRRAFGAVMTPAFPKRGPDAGTMDQVRPHCAAWHHTTLTVDWPTYPLQAPSGGGRAPTPDRSKTPAKGYLASGEEGLTNRSALRRSRAKDGPRLDRRATSATVFERERRNALRLLRPAWCWCPKPPTSAYLLDL